MAREVRVYLRGGCVHIFVRDEIEDSWSMCRDDELKAITWAHIIYHWYGVYLNPFSEAGMLNVEVG